MGVNLKKTSLPYASAMTYDDYYRFLENNPGRVVNWRPKRQHDPTRAASSPYPDQE